MASSDVDVTVPLPEDPAVLDASPIFSNSLHSSSFFSSKETLQSVRPRDVTHCQGKSIISDRVHVVIAKAVALDHES